jgi:hypothetical protein
MIGAWFKTRLKYIKLGMNFIFNKLPSPRHCAATNTRTASQIRRREGINSTLFFASQLYANELSNSINSLNFNCDLPESPRDTSVRHI